jgi:hypothetical protein
MAWRLAGIPLANYDMMPDFNRDRTATHLISLEHPLTPSADS